MGNLHANTVIRVKMRFFSKVFVKNRLIIIFPNIFLHFPGQTSLNVSNRTIRLF